MNLYKLFRLYLEQAKNQALTLFDNDRTRACHWIEKIELSPASEEQDKILQLHALKLLLLSLESNCLTGPFEEYPAEEKDFKQYDWNSYKLNDFSDMIRSKLDAQKRPEILYAVSGNRRGLVTYQDNPTTGQHLYYACSREPVEQWENLEGGAVRKESIKQWQERGQYEELNDKESQNSSIDVPRCQMQSTNPQVDFTVYDERQSDQSQRRKHNFASKSLNPGSSRHHNHHQLPSKRPETPARLGGSKAQTRPYEMEEFGLSRNEQFRSPRGVFENLNYDQFQVQKNPASPRITDEVIDSFNNAKMRCASLRQEERDDVKKQLLCAKLQKIRAEMNQKPEVKVQQYTKDEPESFHYEPLTLQEPCVKVHSSPHQETEQDLGILSSGEMDDDGMFDEQQEIDPRTIFKTKDENLVSRNLFKFETKTTINGSTREVTEELLEKEDVRIQENTEENENLEDVSEPAFESPAVHSSVQYEDMTQNRPREAKPRRIPVHYSDLTQEDLENISQPSFQGESFKKYHESATPCQQQVIHGSKASSGRQMHLEESPDSRQASSARSQPERRSLAKHTTYENLDEICPPNFPSTFQDSGSSNTTKFVNRPLPRVDTSERVDDICRPAFASTFKDSRSIQHQANRLSNFYGSENVYQVKQSDCRRCFDNAKRTPYFNESERLEDVCHPNFPSSFEDSSRAGRSFRKPDVSERLDNISQPIYDSLVENSRQRSERSRRTLRERLFFRAEESERLDDIEQPDYRSYEDSTPQSRKSRAPFAQRPIHQFDESELDDVCEPEFQSFENSTARSKRSGMASVQRPMLQVETSERLDEISRPQLVPSFRDSTLTSKTSKRIQTGKPQAQGETSKCLDQVSRPEFVYSSEDYCQLCPGRKRSPSAQRPLREIETSERLDMISKPQCMSSIRDSMMKSRQSRGHNESENLCDVSEPCFESSYENSNLRPGGNYQEKHADVTENCQPDFPPSFHSTRTTQQRPLFQVDESERIEDVDQPEFQYSIEGSTRVSEENKCPHGKLLPNVDIYERLDRVCPPDFSSTFDGSNQKQIPKNSFFQKHMQAARDQKQRIFSNLDTSEVLENISQPAYRSTIDESIIQDQRNRHISKPSFYSSLKESSNSLRRNRNAPVQERFPKLDQSERLEDVSQPSFSDSVKHSTAVPSYGDDSEKLDEIRAPNFPSSFEDSKNKSRILQFSQINDSERLENICEPDFPISFEDTVQSPMPSQQRTRSRNTGQQKNISNLSHFERLSDVCQPKFLSSIEGSMQTMPALKTFPREVLEDRSTQKSSDVGSRSLQGQKQQFDDCELLDDVTNPEFPSTFQDDPSIQRFGKYRKTPNQRNFNAVDISERLEDVCPPEFTTSFQHSTHNSRRNEFMQMQKSFPRESSKDCPCSLDRSRPNSVYKRRSGSKPRHLPENNSQFDDCELLEDVTRPEFPSTFLDSNISSERRRKTTGGKPMPQVDISENIELVCQPEFPTSFEDSLQNSRNKNNQSRRTQKSFPNEVLEDFGEPSFLQFFDRSSQRSSNVRSRCSPVKKRQLDGCELLEDITSPEFPSTLQEDPSLQRSERYRNIHEIDLSEKLDDVCPPEFGDSLQHSIHNCRRNELMQTQKPFTREIGTDRSGQRSTSRTRPGSQPRQQNSIEDGCDILEDISKLEFPSTFLNSNISSERDRGTIDRRPMPQFDMSENIESEFPTSFEGAMQDSRNNRSRRTQKSFPNEVLEDVGEPSFSHFLDHSTQRSTNVRSSRFPGKKPQLDGCELLEDITRPEFPSTFQDNPSLQVSEGNGNAHSSGQISISRTRPRHLLQQSSQDNTCQMLEDISKPEFPSTLLNSNISSERGRITFERRPMPQVDFSENIESVCQPEFPTSFEDSENKPLTYRNCYSRLSNFPKENLCDVTAPTLHSDSVPKSPHLSLPAENPPFQSSRRRLEDCRSKNPQRQMFHQHNSTRAYTERPGDYMQVFQSMPNYARFEDQIAPTQCPTGYKEFASRIKLPGTFGHTKATTARCNELRRPEINVPGPVPQPQMKTQQKCYNHLKVPVQRIQTSQMTSRRNINDSGLPVPTASSSRIPPAPCQTKKQCQPQRHNKELANDNERFVKKSSVKLHITKSTYSKNQENKSKRNQASRR